MTIVLIVVVAIIVIAVLYFILSYPLSLLAKHLEKKAMRS